LKILILTLLIFLLISCSKFHSSSEIPPFQMKSSASLTQESFITEFAPAETIKNASMSEQEINSLLIDLIADINRYSDNYSSFLSKVSRRTRYAYQYGYFKREQSLQESLNNWFTNVEQLKSKANVVDLENIQNFIQNKIDEINTNREIGSIHPYFSFFNFMALINRLVADPNYSDAEKGHLIDQILANGVEDQQTTLNIVQNSKRLYLSNNNEFNWLSDKNALPRYVDSITTTLSELNTKFSFNTSITKYGETLLQQLIMLSDSLISRKTELSAKTIPVELYQQQLKNYGIDESPEEIYQHAMNALSTDSQTLAAITNEIDKRSFPMIASKDDLHHAIDSYRSQIELSLKTRMLFPIPNEKLPISYDIDEISNPRISYTFDSNSAGKILLPSFTSLTNSFPDLLFHNYWYAILAHEDRPGHALQFAMIKENLHLLTRTWLSKNSANVEGWAHYAEWMMMQELNPNDLETRYFSLQAIVLREVRALVESGLVLGKISFDEAVSLFEEHVGYSHESALNETIRMMGDGDLSTIGQGSTYFYGISKIRNLKSKFIKKYHSSERSFHETYLSYGFTRLSVIENNLN